MDKPDSLQGEYYQTIAGEFLRSRGAPYFLSARDLALIAEWEERKIPLAAVLEGIVAAFDRRKGKPDQGKILSLSFCARSVETAYSQHRDRRAGGRRAGPSRSAKIELARGEAERILRSPPESDPRFKVLYERGVKILGSEGPDEDILEKLDEETDEIIWGSAAPEEKESWRRVVRREFAGRDGREIEGIARARLIMARREERRIPYLSLFYY